MKLPVKLAKAFQTLKQIDGHSSIINESLVGKPAHWSKIALDLAHIRSRNETGWPENKLSYAKENNVSHNYCHRLLSGYDDYNNVCSIVKRFQEKNPEHVKAMPSFSDIFLAKTLSAAPAVFFDQDKTAPHGITQISRIGKLLHHSTEVAINDLYWQWIDGSLKEDDLKQAEKIWLNKSDNNRTIGRPLGRASKLESSDGVFAYQKYASSVMVDAISRNPSDYGLSGKIIKMHKGLEVGGGVTAGIALLMQDTSTEPHLKTVHIEINGTDGISTLKKSGADVRVLIVMPNDKNADKFTDKSPFSVIKLKSKNEDQFDFEIDYSKPAYNDDMTPTESTGKKIKFMSACLLSDHLSPKGKNVRKQSFY